MSQLLLEIKANKLRNRTLFPHKLAIYDDKVVYKHRTLFKISETTITYNHMSQVDVTRSFIFASLEIINTGGVKDILIKYVKKKYAIQAKSIIDQKIQLIHNSSQHPEYKKHTGDSVVVKTEKALNRLKELHKKGSITEKEFKKRRDKVLKTLK